jgi:hypothetical protein
MDISLDGADEAKQDATRACLLHLALGLTALARSLCFTPPTKSQDCAVSGPAHVEAFKLDIAPFCNPTFSHYRAFELVTSIAEIATVRS